jgi:glutamyl-tRNA reductase
MTTNNSVQVSVLGLGAMGSALAGALVKAGYATAVWNRTPEKADDLVAQGAQAAATAGLGHRSSTADRPRSSISTSHCSTCGDPVPTSVRMLGWRPCTTSP